jgi:hypothetical protein
VLQLVNPSPRGGAGTTVPKQKRTVRNLTVPHYQIDDAIYAEEVQGVRALGQENQAQTVQDMVNQRMATHTAADARSDDRVPAHGRGARHHPERRRHDAVQPVHGVQRRAAGEVAFDLTNNANGVVRKLCTDVTRTIATALGGIPYTGRLRLLLGQPSGTTSSRTRRCARPTSTSRRPPSCAPAWRTRR